MMILLRGYLLFGLVAHKLIWMILERRASAAPTGNGPPRSIKVLAIKTVKIAILLGIAVQTMLPEVLPIMGEAAQLQILGTLIYSLGWVVAVLGRVQLGGNWSNIETATVLSEQRVVCHGLYRFIRHPIYTGDLLLLIGLELACNSWLVLGAVALAPIVTRQAVREESLLRERLPGYPDYCRTTKRFVPFVV